MTEAAFQKGWQRLVAVFSPYECPPEMAREYYRTFGEWDERDWDETVTQLIDGQGRSGQMPLPYQVKEVYARVRSSRPSPTKNLRSCESCISGKVYYLDDQGKEKYAACSCKSGDIVAGQILMGIYRRTGRGLRKEHVRFDTLANRRKNIVRMDAARRAEKELVLDESQSDVGKNLNLLLQRRR